MASTVTTLGLCLVLLSCLLADAEPRHFDHDPYYPRPYYPVPRPSKQAIPIKPVISKPDISCSSCKETCLADCDECDQCTLCSLCFGSTEGLCSRCKYCVGGVEACKGRCEEHQQSEQC